MNIVLIHGQGHKGVTYTLSHTVLNYLMQDGDELKEFFLPQDGPGFCIGCNSCFLRGEEHCPGVDKTKPIAQAIEWSDVVMLDTPNYAMDISGSMKNLLDHLCYRWVTHRPHGSMFLKVGVVLSSSAGAPPKAAVKSLSKKLKWMCISRVYKFPFISKAMGPNDLSSAKKIEIDCKSKKISRKVRKAAANPKARLRTKLPFLMFRKMQKGASGGWNPTDIDWWKKQGWLDDTLPWK